MPHLPEIPGKADSYGPQPDFAAARALAPGAASRYPNRIAVPDGCRETLRRFRAQIVMTVCLVIPPSPFLLDERVFMSLGVLRVAAALEQAKAGRVEVIDLSGVSNFLDAIAAHAAAQPAAPTYGITATSPQLPAAVKIAAAIRTAAPQSRIILGGPHPTLANAAAKREGKRGQPGRGTRAMDALRRGFS